MSDFIMSAGFHRSTLRWLWPVLFIMALSCIRKSILGSLPFEQIQEGLILYIGYLLLVIPTGIILSKSKLFDDESKLALILICVTYFFFDYSIIFATWERLTKLWVARNFYNKQHTVFIIAAVFCGIALMLILRKMDQRSKNLKILLITTFVLSVVPFIDYLQTPSYTFESDLFNIKLSRGPVNQESVPRRIFWIILDEHPSSLVLDEELGYKDTTFRRGLESLGFTVYDSCFSNYNYSPISIASTTYGAMLPVNGKQNYTFQQWFLLEDRIRESPVVTFFRAQKYDTHILSFIGAEFKKTFDSDRGQVVTYRGEIIASSFIGAMLSQFENKQAVSVGFYNAEIVDSLHALLNPISNKDRQIFVYAHLIMPHGPYLPLERQNKPWNGQYFEQRDGPGFLSHVKYTDSIILNLMHDGLEGLSPDLKSNTLVILQSDHGCRISWRNEKDVPLKPSFGILNAVLWPKNSNVKFYNGMSSVNTFRIMFRDLWGINLDALKDSSVNVHPLID